MSNAKRGAASEYNNHEGNDSWYEYSPEQQDKRVRLVESIHQAKKEMAKKAQKNQQ